MQQTAQYNAEEVSNISTRTSNGAGECPDYRASIQKYHARVSGELQGFSGKNEEGAVGFGDSSASLGECGSTVGVGE
jgi:hypothetical protein